MKSEWEEHHPAVSSSCLLQRVTPLGRPTRTPTHIEPQPAQTNRGIKRRIVWKRGETHLINLSGTFHSTAVCFYQRVYFSVEVKVTDTQTACLKIQNVQRHPQVIIYTVCNLHAAPCFWTCSCPLRQSCLWNGIPKMFGHILFLLPGWHVKEWGAGLLWRAEESTSKRICTITEFSW